MDYAELHCHSHFSFGDGADSPQQLATEAARLGLSALALTDHDGYYGVAQFAEAAAEANISTVFGAELSIELPAATRGQPDPQGKHLVVLARDPEGYRRLSRAITQAQLTGSKDHPRYSVENLAELADGHWLILTGCRKGAVPAALESFGADAAKQQLDQLIALFGRHNVAVELIHHDQAGDDDRIAALADIAQRSGVEIVATNNVHYAAPSRQPLAQVLAATRSRRELDALDGWLPAAGVAHLRSPQEMAVRFAAYPHAVAHAAELAKECAFDLSLLKPELPGYKVPVGHTEFSYLAKSTLSGARQRYGSPTAERVSGAYSMLDHELGIIKELDFAGYFLIVADIVDFATKNGIFCQGRGSAANSAVCYALGITNVDAIRFDLLFERFLSAARDGPPDIDLDIESRRREEVIQYVYNTYGRTNAAQVANVISYRPRSAVRDVAKAFGYGDAQALSWSKQLERGGHVKDSEVDDLPAAVAELAQQLLTTPRHLGLHPGGMVICRQAVSEFCPVEWARAEDRSVLQWDKDDCAFAGLVKFDLLGLGMLSALRYALELISEHHGIAVDLAQLPETDADVYAMLQAADTVGVFQVESRAQMGTLPRLKPTKFYDLVVEVALIRPGPIQGGAVHPYLRRRREWERYRSESWKKEVHPKLQDALAKTYGVPLFQEQLMQMAIDAAGFDAGQADQLRKAMGSKRSQLRMNKLKGQLFSGMAERGITGKAADQIFQQLLSFADFGFPESHAASFAYIAYSSAWLKCHYPAAFTAALLNAQPMGFYSVNTLVADARRHGVAVRRPDVNASQVTASLEPCDAVAEHPVYATAAIRLGLSQVRGINSQAAERIASGRPFKDMSDVARRARLSQSQLEALSVAGAFECFDVDRREALWISKAAAGEVSGTLPGTSLGTVAPTLPGMSTVELSGADYWAVGLSPDSHPVQFVRSLLDSEGFVKIDTLPHMPTGSRVYVAGLVTHRQRPATAGGVTFINLEDETGMLNVICSQGLWQRHRRLARTAVALRVRGVLECVPGVTNLVADKLEQLDLPLGAAPSRDFR